MNELRWLTIELILDQVENKQNLRYHLGQFFILYTFCLSKRQDNVVLDEIWSNSEAQNGFKYFLSIIISMHLRFSWNIYSDLPNKRPADLIIFWKYYHLHNYSLGPTHLFISDEKEISLVNTGTWSFLAWSVCCLIVNWHCCFIKEICFDFFTEMIENNTANDLCFSF